MTEYRYGDDGPVDPAYTSSSGDFNRDFYTEDQFDQMELNGTPVDVDIFFMKPKDQDMIELLSKLDDAAVQNEMEGIVEMAILN